MLTAIFGAIPENVWQKCGKDVANKIIQNSRLTLHQSVLQAAWHHRFRCGCKYLRLSEYLSDLVNIVLFSGHIRHDTAELHMYVADNAA